MLLNVQLSTEQPCSFAKTANSDSCSEGVNSHSNGQEGGWDRRAGLDSSGLNINKLNSSGNAWKVYDLQSFASV